MAPRLLIIAGEVSGDHQGARLASALRRRRPALEIAGVGGQEMAAAGVGAERSLAAPPRGFDVPLAWSADGAYLAVRFFEGSSVTNPGRSWVMVVGGSKRQTVAATSDIEVLGWRNGGG